jgi:PAS domain S-box-containing protein
VSDAEKSREELLQVIAELRAELDRAGEREQDRKARVGQSVPALDSDEIDDSLTHRLNEYRAELETQNDELLAVQSELECARDRYADLYDNAPVAYFTVDGRGTIRECNGTFLAMIGFEREHALGKPLTHYLDKKMSYGFFAEIANLKSDPRPRTFELTFKGVAESIVAVVEARPVEDADEFLVRMAATDDTERAKERRRVDEEREQLVSIFDGIDEGVYISDPDTYEILYVNKAMRDIFGEIKGRICYQALQGKSEPCSFCTNDLIFGKKLGEAHIWEFYNPQAERWFRCIDKALRWPGGGLARYEMALDVTEKKLAEHQLVRRLAQEEAVAVAGQALGEDADDSIDSALQVLLEAAEVDRAYFFENHLGEDGELLMSKRNEACAPGVKSEMSNPDLQGLPYSTIDRWRELLSNNDSLRGLVETFPEEEREVLESQGILSMCIIPVFSGAEWLGFIGFDDMTSKREWSEDEVRLLRVAAAMIGSHLNRRKTKKALEEYAEELRESNAAKDKFFSIIAHDLKSPFHGLLGMTEALVEGRAEMSDEQADRFARRILNVVENSYELIENLLNWSRLQTKGLETSPKDVALRESVRRAFDAYEHVARAKGVRLVNEISESATAFVDAYSLDAIVRNLTANAVKFNEKGGSVVASVERAGDLATLVVRDNGVGVSEENIRKLFRVGEVFTTPGTGGEHGSGLGLLLCKELAVKNGGDLRLESEVGVGTSVVVEMPAFEKTGDKINKRAAG